MQCLHMSINCSLQLILACMLFCNLVFLLRANLCWGFHKQECHAKDWWHWHHHPVCQHLHYYVWFSCHTHSQDFSSCKLLLESQSDTFIGHINDWILTSVYRAGKVLYPVCAISHLRPTLITSWENTWCCILPRLHNFHPTSTPDVCPCQQWLTWVWL